VFRLVVRELGGAAKEDPAPPFGDAQFHTKSVLHAHAF